MAPKKVKEKADGPLSERLTKDLERLWLEFQLGQV